MITPLNNHHILAKSGLVNNTCLVRDDLVKNTCLARNDLVKNTWSSHEWLWKEYSLIRLANSGCDLKEYSVKPRVTFEKNTQGVSVALKTLKMYFTT